MHNQNDVGNVIVHTDGESVISDIGRGRYTKAYFGSERYEHIANSSRGHSVPVPNGQEQLPGGEHGARLLEHRGRLPTPTWRRSSCGTPTRPRPTWTRPAHGRLAQR